MIIRGDYLLLLKRFAMRKKVFNLTEPVSGLYAPRREFLKKGAIIGTLTGLAGLSLVSGCKEEGEEVTPSEDLMREHGVLNRIMLIYDTCSARLVTGEQFPVEALHNSAQIIRSFIEDYHEMLEEKFLFPRFVNANKLVDLVQLLYVQHHAGKVLTDQILQLGNSAVLKNPDDTRKLVELLTSFNRMYRPHEAREDSVLFPALRSIVSRNEYFAMGEDFEKKEHELFGQDGFETMVNKVAELEKQLGIYDMAAFTPSV
jgi:hemerythrin-like domain-containing protein